MTLTRTESTPAPRYTSGDVHRLLVLHGPAATDLGQSRTLTDAPLGVGREVEDGQGLQLVHARVSRRHALIAPAQSGRGFQLRDLGSRNGTFVNGERVEVAELRDGDVIRIGSSLILFQFLDAAACNRVLQPEAIVHQAIVGHGHALARVREGIHGAPSHAPTLIVGETGVGKELVARAIHDHSRRVGSFVPVNCAALPSNLAESELFGHVRGAFTGADARTGLFGRADQGTLFMDEIGELSAEVQAKLLRALAIGEVRQVGSDHSRQLDVGIIAATNVDLETAVANGRFRADLYARLMSHIIVVPPLRERREDVLELVRHFLRGGGGAEISADCAEALLIHGWPYNVRELEQIVSAAIGSVREHGTLELADLPARIRARIEARREPSEALPAAPHPLLDLRRDAVPNAEELQAVMRAYAGNVAKVAGFFRKDRRQIYRWAQALGVDLQSFRTASADRADRANRPAHEPRAETLPPGPDDGSLH